MISNYMLGGGRVEQQRRMSGAQRRLQILRIAEDEFAASGLHGASTESIARQAGITQAYIFRIFGTKKALFLEVVVASFERVTQGMRDAAGRTTGQEALSFMGEKVQRTTLRTQLTSVATAGLCRVRRPGGSRCRTCQLRAYVEHRRRDHRFRPSNHQVLPGIRNAPQ